MEEEKKKMNWFDRGAAAADQKKTGRRSWFEKTLRVVLRSGPTPRSVAFIMDGNRRYARKANLQSAIDGHAAGFETLTKVLDWCRDFDIEEVTMYAFSIENFKRSVDEVDALMNLARRKFQQLLSEKDKVLENGVRFRFLGNFSLLPDDLRQVIDEVASISEGCRKVTVNVCLAYTSQDEMTRAVKRLAERVHSGQLNPSEISEEDFDSSLDTGCNLRPDLLIRTSGEYRLSDFLLWQASETCLCFDKVLWPEFNYWHLCYAILHYQLNYRKISNVKSSLS